LLSKVLADFAPHGSIDSNKTRARVAAKRTWNSPETFNEGDFRRTNSMDKMRADASSYSANLPRASQSSSYL
jgi:hypothetical protein